MNGAAVFFPLLLLLPQRYKFSSKSQHPGQGVYRSSCCCCYRKGTNFQANHNKDEDGRYLFYVVVATAKVQIFKQITTPVCKSRTLHTLLLLPQRYKFSSKSQRFVRAIFCPVSCCCYRKGTNFQANHNRMDAHEARPEVVVATAKVQIFKQITTFEPILELIRQLLLLPQRYKFSSKSQQ